MRRFVLVTVIAIAQWVAGGPAVGQTKKQTGPPTEPAKAKNTNSQPPQRGTEDAPFIVQITNSPHTQAGATQQKAPQKDFYDKFGIWCGAAIALFTFALVVVGAWGVSAAVRTLKAIERQVAVQEVAMTQWIDVKSWRCEPTALPDGESFIKQMAVYFDVENPTSFPLVIPGGNINLTLGNGTVRCFTGDGARLNPRQPQIKDVPLRMTDEQSRQYMEGEVMVNVEGQLNFVDVLGRKQPHPVHGILWCSTREARFQSDVMWEHRADGQKA